MPLKIAATVSTEIWARVVIPPSKENNEAFSNKGPRFKSPHLFRNGQLVEGTEGKYGPDIASDFLCDFIDRKRDQPFLIYYPMILVHNPFDPTPDSVDWNDRKSQRTPLERFKDMVEYMDKIVGKIVEKLEDTGQLENTLIVVTGDNGTNTGITSPYPGRGEIQGGKGKMTDAGNRVAFVASWPGHMKAGSVVDKLIDFGDVMPTITEAIGAELPKTAVGQSFLPLMKGDSSHARDWVFMSYSRNGGGLPFKCFVRDKDWKLYADGSLYNVPNDWLEKAPVDGDAGKDARQRLQPILDRILKETPKATIQSSSQPSGGKRKKKPKKQ